MSRKRQDNRSGPVRSRMMAQAEIDQYMKKGRRTSAPAWIAQTRDEMFPEARLDVDLYFAYGSNLDIDQMAGRCRDAEPIAAARLYGHSLVFRSVADVAKASVPGVYVPGGLWKISPADLKALDRYEGYPYLYGRHVVTVATESGRLVKAWVYTMKNDRTQMIPTPGYLATIERGYQDFNLQADMGKLTRAISRAGAWCQRNDISKVYRVGKRYQPVGRPAPSPVKASLPRWESPGMSPATRAELKLALEEEDLEWCSIERW